MKKNPDSKGLCDIFGHIIFIRSVKSNVKRAGQLLQEDEESAISWLKNAPMAFSGRHSLEPMSYTGQTWHGAGTRAFYSMASVNIGAVIFQNAIAKGISSKKFVGDKKGFCDIFALSFQQQPFVRRDDQVFFLSFKRPSNELDQTLRKDSGSFSGQKSQGNKQSRGT